jgi:D-alanyl-D-alanine carboxypeptidase
MRLTRFLIITIGLLAMIVIFWFVLPWEKLGQAEIFLTQDVKNSPTNPTFTLDSLQAKAGVVMDEKTGHVLFSKNANSPLPLASITKLMTAIVAKDHLNPDETITITASDLSDGSNAGLSAGSVWRFSDLKDYMLTTSSNGAAKAIGRAVFQKTGREFVFLMNTKAKTLHLDSLRFTNESGLDGTAGQAGGLGSALDVAKLMSYIIKNEPSLIESTKFSAIRRETVDHNIFFGQNTNVVIRTIPGFMGSKTGYTDQAGGNLVIAFDAGLDMPIIAVALGSTQDGRFSDIQKMVAKTIETLAK